MYRMEANHITPTGFYTSTGANILMLSCRKVSATFFDKC